MPQNNCLLVGAGPMAEEYAKVLNDLSVSTTVIGRGAESAARFKQKTGLDVVLGGIEANLELNEIQQMPAIVATPVDTLLQNCQTLLDVGAKKILVEKPAGLSPEETDVLSKLARQHQASVYVAYNRRFYDASLKARKLIEEDGGATSLRMEFSEFSHRIADLPTPAHIKNAWLYANSTHVLDLGFNLAGFPKSLHATCKGGLPWHKAAAQFAGHGETESGALFSYIADWEAAPRWSVEVGTRRRTITFQPLEQLKYREKTGFVETVIDIDPIDTAFKPGLWRQTGAFIMDNSDSVELCGIEEHANHMQNVYRAILNGS